MLGEKASCGSISCRSPDGSHSATRRAFHGAAFAPCDIGGDGFTLGLCEGAGEGNTQLAVLLQRIDVLLFKDDGDALVGEDARHRPRWVGHDLVGVVFLLHLVAVCLILLAGDPAVGGYPELADQFVAFGYKNVRINLSLFEAMFFHCRAGSASALKAEDHDRKAERLLYRSLSAFDMDGCSEALNRGMYQMVCSQWSNACRLFLRRV